MAEVKVTPLGAGQEVGRSCVLINIGDALIMADCGAHMGYRNYKKYPDFSMVAEGDLTGHIDCVLLSHFHMDHCGSLPFFTEKVGYSGPLYMTAPTHAIAPLLLQDSARITASEAAGKGGGGRQATKADDVDTGKDLSFSEADIANCMKKAKIIGLRETVQVPGKDIRITAFYAGHVLGACMFLIEVRGVSVLYTGDYNTASDRHLLGAHVVPGLRPNVVITESTYGSTVRDSRRQRERDFLQLVHETVRKGGKVLIPVFAMGRAQELLILLETFWTRMKLDVPIYFSAGMVGRANEYYKLYTSWTSDAVRDSSKSSFEFPNVRVFDQAHLNTPGPCVLFSSPGMLHAGQSLRAFKAWCTGEDNTVIIPGFCVEGTIGHTILTSENPVLTIDGRTYDVKCNVTNMSFSAHADGRGILRLIQTLSPEAVVLVHGDYDKAMKPLKAKIELETGIPTKMPKNGQMMEVKLNRALIPVAVDAALKPVASDKLLAALKSLEDYGAECLEQLKKARKVAPSGDVHRGVVVRAGDKAAKWWEKWGVCVEEYIDDTPATGPAALDCGCDLAWEEKLTTVLTSVGPKYKYRPLGVAGHPWGTVQTFPIVIVAEAGGEDNRKHGSISTITAHDALAWLADMNLKECAMTFKATIPAPADAPPAPLGTLLPAMLTAIRGCSPGFDWELMQDAGGAPTGIAGGTVVIEVTPTGCDVAWQFQDKHAAMRAHACISNTWGVAF
eukprot:TRINITY_DN29739_c0_g1_i1.p1 TRINITY_DN29739_c0_g1~~TRINITY_DN29739_c0_g1_i1.p1  ORF type:complete len:754 (+),score=224.15 TRINITY_DN29739_c0_g1_i1:77-2263(+)